MTSWCPADTHPAHSWIAVLVIRGEAIVTPRCLFLANKSMWWLVNSFPRSFVCRVGALWWLVGSFPWSFCVQGVGFSFCLTSLLSFEPSHEIMVLFVLRKLILQTRMHSHPVGLDVRFLVKQFIYFHTSCVRTAKALARPRGRAGSPEPSLVANVISTIISSAQSDQSVHCPHQESLGP